MTAIARAAPERIVADVIERVHNVERGFDVLRVAVQHTVGDMFAANAKARRFMIGEKCIVDAGVEVVSAEVLAVQGRELALKLTPLLSGAPKQVELRPVMREVKS